MYAILRVEKCKTIAALGSRAAHNLRLNQAAPHADPKKLRDNQHLAGGDDFDRVMGRAGARLASAGKFRKDAVLGLEVMLSASPEFFDQVKPDPRKWKAWRDASMAWLKATFGAENIVSAQLHLDESTPHIQALVIPVHDGKLRASHWLDGPAKLSKMQDSYAAQVDGLGLRRGERGSKAKHVELKSFYALASKIAAAVEGAKGANKPPKLPDRGMLGRVSDDDWRKLASDLERYGREGLRLRAESVAGQLIAASGVGQEAARRAEEARKRATEAEKLLAEVQAKVQAAEGFLARQRDEFNARHTEIKQLDAEIERRREWLGMRHLESQRDDLVNEIKQLRQQRER